MYCDDSEKEFWLCGGVFTESSVGSCLFKKNGLEVIVVTPEQLAKAAAAASAAASLGSEAAAASGESASVNSSEANMTGGSDEGSNTSWASNESSDGVAADEAGDVTHVGREVVTSNASVLAAAPWVFRKQADSWCPEGAIDPAHPETYTDLEEAERVCTSSGSCTGVYDHGCDHAGEFWLCSGKYNSSPSRSCVYVKQELSAPRMSGV